MTESQKLLADYVENDSEAAFRELVSRYLSLVYSTALRVVAGDTHLAEDVTQTVFMRLSRKARRLSHELMLGGWLHRDTWYVASKTMRRERRRQAREHQAVFMNSLQDHTEANLEKVAPILDEAINRLGNEDRTAILLRFFEQRDYRSVGEVLGSSEDAARMRINRALEKLHALLQHQGITFSAAALGTALASGAITAAPSGLAASVAATALLTSSGGGALTALLKMLTLTKLKTGIIGALLVAGVATIFVIEYQTRPSEKDDRLQQKKNQRAQLMAENVRFSKQVDQASRSRSLADNQGTKLLKLRGEVGRLRDENNTLAQTNQETDPFDTKVFYAGGEFLTPGMFVWTNGMTLTSAVAAARGLSDWADRSQIHVKQANGTTITFDYLQAISSQQDVLRIGPGDLIFAPRLDLNDPAAPEILVPASSKR